MYEDDNYTIYFNQNINHGRKKMKFILINKQGGYKNHGHFKHYQTCERLIEIMNQKIVPEKRYLQDAIIRITTDINYIEDIKRKQKKIKNKQYYINVNKGRKCKK